MPANEITGSYLAGQGRSSFGNRSHDEYLPVMEDHVHTGRPLPKLIAKKRGTMGGKRSLTSIINAYPASMGISLFEYDDQPTPRSPTYFNPEIISRRDFGRMRWTWEVQIMARKGKSVAWAEPKAEDMRVGRIQFELNFARKLYLGPYQVMGTVTGAPAGAVYTLYSRDSRNSQNDNRHKYGAHWLRVGMSLGHVAANAGAVDAGGSLVDSNVTAGGAYQNERYITAIDKSNEAAPTFTLDAAFTSATGDESVIVPFRSRVDAPGADGANTDSNFAGPNGLHNIVATTGRKTYYLGVSRTTYPSMSGWVDDRAGALTPFNEDRISFAVDKTNDDGTGDDPDTMLCHRSIRREYVKETKGDRRFDAVLKTKGWAPRLAFEAGDVLLPIMTDRDCPPNLMYALETEGFGWLSEADLQSLEEGERFVQNKAAHEIILVKSGNCMHWKPHNNVVIEDIMGSTTGLTDAP